MEPESDSDVVLMQRLAEGEDMALNELMTRWRDRIGAFLLRMVGDHATAMDLTQETFVRLYTSRHRYQPKAAFSTYLFHIAANLGRSHARWKGRHPTVAMENQEGDLIHEPIDSQLTPDAAAVLHEKTAMVNQALSTLQPDLREALLLFTVEGMSQADIAATLGCTAKAVEVRVYRARQALKEAFARLPS